MSTLFNASNPQIIVYENEIIQITVLGGIKLENLAQLRCTLKIEVKGTSIPPIRHSLDLYNDTQVDKICRKCTNKLEIGLSVIEASIAELIDNLEACRLQELESEADSQIKQQPLSEQERQEVLAFLQQKNLLENTNALIGKSGVVGEENNRLLMYLIFTTRLREQPLHIVSLGASGTGKTHLQEKVAELIPDDEKLEITQLSENAFYYFGQQELKHKLILIEDLDGADSVLYPLRELQSKKRISKAVSHKNKNGQTQTIHLVVEGPVSVAGCTTKESIYEDNANRSFLIYLDTSKEQDNNILKYQQLKKAGKIDESSERQARHQLRNVQRVLEPIKVINPYATEIYLPKEVFKPRRSMQLLLNFIETVTFYHQHQRHQEVDTSTGEMFIETTIEDIKNAFEIIKETLFRKSDELGGASRNFYQTLLELSRNKKIKTKFYAKDVRAILRIHPRTLRRYLTELREYNYLEASKSKQYSLGYEYQINKSLDQKVLKSAIDKHLQTIIDNIQAKDNQHTKLKSKSVSRTKQDKSHTVLLKE